MEPPRHEEGTDPELAAALGIQISDERTQEANVLGYARHRASLGETRLYEYQLRQ